MTLQILKAIEEARKDFKELKKSGKNPMFKNGFSTIDDIFDACKTPMEKQGINISFHTYVNETIAKDILVLTLTHLPSGEKLSSETIMLDDKLKGAQAVGSGMTYMRRYMLQAMLNLEADSDTDDDGTKTTHGKPDTSNVKELKGFKKDSPKDKDNMTAKNLTDADYSYQGEPYRVWTGDKDMEIFNDVKPWAMRLKKLLESSNDDDKESMRDRNDKEVVRILKEIQSHQNKEQKWKDEVTKYINDLFYGGQESA